MGVIKFFKRLKLFLKIIAVILVIMLVLNIFLVIIFAIKQLDGYLKLGFDSVIGYDMGSNSSSGTSGMNVKAISVSEAKTKYKDEYENAYKKHESDTVFATVTKENIEGASHFIVHVVISNGDQIFGEPANGIYGTGCERTSAAYSRVNTKLLHEDKGLFLAVNGSHFLYGDGKQDTKQETNRVVIVNGKVEETGPSDGMEILLKSDGTFYTEAGKSGADLVTSGVKYSFASHDTHFIENGKIPDEASSELNADGSMKKYKSTVIGMVSSGEYYILVGESTNFAAAQYLQKKGCIWAKSMDQGGSVTLVFKGEILNKDTLSDGAERPVGDFLMFSE